MKITNIDSSMSESSRKFFSGSMKMSDLIDINYNLLWSIERIGLGFGFGDDTVEEACARKGINLNTFLLICNVYTFDGYIPSRDMLNNTELRDIVKYLHESHSYYMEIAVKNLADALEYMLESCGETQRKIIWKFFTDYKKELELHFDYEERIAFPYINAVLEHTESGDYNIVQYEENHTNIEEKLNDLKNIVMKYMPSQCDNRRICNVLFYLYRLEEDLEKHTLIEDDILVPVVNRLEEQLKLR